MPVDREDDDIRAVPAAELPVLLHSSGSRNIPSCAVKIMSFCVSKNRTSCSQPAASGTHTRIFFQDSKSDETAIHRTRADGHSARKSPSRTPWGRTISTYRFPVTLARGGSSYDMRACWKQRQIILDDTRRRLHNIYIDPFWSGCMSRTPGAVWPHRRACER